MNKATRRIVSLATGILFGLGLGISGMMDREKVLGFLDIAGAWDPTLMFVLGGAVGTTLVAFRFVLQRKGPVFAGQFNIPTVTAISPGFVGATALFGVGWGIAGYCPGPGIAALVLGSWSPVLFLIAFTVGTVLSGRVSRS